MSSPPERPRSRAVTPGLRRLLAVMLPFFALIAANSLYLAGVTLVGFVLFARLRQRIVFWF